MAGNLTDGLKSAVPSSVILQAVIIFNHRGESLEISDLVAEINIRESLYFPSLIFDVYIAEAMNFFEEFELIGQEKIQIKFQKTPNVEGAEEQLIDYEFFVTEYPAFSKDAKAQTQNYAIRGMSEFAYVSNFKKISRSYSSNAGTEIQRIMTKDLKFPEDQFVIKGNEKSSHRGIINIQSPLSAVHYFKNTAYDENGAPFFFYQTIDNNVNFTSFSYLVGEENVKYDDYSYLEGFTHLAETEEDYIERAKRILNLSSKIQLSKLFQAKNGAYASRNRFLDFTNKTYTDKIYKYSDKIYNPINKKNSLSTSFLVGDETEAVPISDLYDAHLEYISINSGAFSKNLNYSSNLKLGIEKLNAYSELFSTFKQEFGLLGDFELKAGTKIGLEFPKAIDYDVYKESKNMRTDDLDHIDRHLSGDYIITSVNHIFKGSGNNMDHTCSILATKDSLTVDI